MMPSPDAISVALHGTQGVFELDVTFDVPMRGITALYGPSGAGKTTVLRCMAGLDRMAGRLAIGDDLWQDSERGVFLPPHQRQTGYVFQETSLFPHLSVRDNLLYGARRAVIAGHATANVDDTVALLGIGHLLEHATTALSGGERQRVAVGRALLSAPKVLLMDEPLSALDRATKDEILPYFERLHEQLSLPIIYVSHDLPEIERLADTLVLIENGRVTAAGPLHDLQTNPNLPLLAAPSAAVVIAATVAHHDTEFALTMVSVAGGDLIVPGHLGRVGETRRLRIAATDVSLARSAPTDSTILNCLPAGVVLIGATTDAPQVNVVLALGSDGQGCQIVARVTRKSLADLQLAPGAAVFAQIKTVSR